MKYFKIIRDLFKFKIPFAVEHPGDGLYFQLQVMTYRNPDLPRWNTDADQGNDRSRNNNTQENGKEKLEFNE